MSLGAGYEYLMRSVARGDGATSGSTPLTRYYAESGSPPGRWLGAGLAHLGDGAGVEAGSEVSHQQLFRLLGMLQDPVTGDPLGRRPHAVATAVAGFDLTFSVPKSVSAVWAIADADTQAAIYHAHTDAVVVALAWVEANVLFTRTGANGAVQAPVRGAVGAAFDHWDSRARDPHLHTHLVLANRVQTLDGRWRTVDGQVLFRYTVALSELHEGVLQDLLSERLGYGWDERLRRHSTAPRWDIAGVPDALIQEFSQRSGQIEQAMPDLVAGFAADHGRQPTEVEMLRLRQTATLATRPDKQQHTLTEQMSDWRARAARHVGADPAAFAHTLTGRNQLPALATDRIDEAMLRDAAAIALDTVATKRSNFGHANVLAEVHRQLHGARFTSPAERVATAERITTLALEAAVQLTEHPHRGASRFTTQRILDAENRLLDLGQGLDGPAAETSANRTAGAPALGDDQHAAVISIATSGHVLDLLIGPAGTGKTTSLAAVRAQWENTYGPGSVIGLAPSAAAAQVLADGLGIDTENTAKWLHETARTPERRAQINALLERIRTTTSSPATALGTRLYNQLDQLTSELNRWSVRPGQLLIIDEASLAGTLALDTITHEAAAAGAKVLLVGDPYQLSAIDAGGAFAMLAEHRPDSPQLTEVRRFDEPWEAAASLQIRVGDPSVIDAYERHGRLHSGDHDAMLDAVYAAWRRDHDAGLQSLMIATDNHTVIELNRRAQADQPRPDAANGVPLPRLADGATAFIGDHIVTRQNDRRLHAGHNWVKNGDTWTIKATHPDGSLDAQRHSDHAVVTLPAEYLTEHVELGYATTTYRAQGRSVDTAHALINTHTSREAVYVAVTRGSQSNDMYIACDADPDHGALDDDLDGRVVLEASLRRTTAATSATSVLRDSDCFEGPGRQATTLRRTAALGAPPGIREAHIDAPEL